MYRSFMYIAISIKKFPRTIIDSLQAIVIISWLHQIFNFDMK